MPDVNAQTRELVQEKASKRIALVIGNGNYTSARKLANPVNDANDMTKTLKELGFEVVSGTDLNRRQMTKKVREFGDRLLATKGVGLFYYAGHGIQVNNKNYLIPVNAEIPREDEVDFAAFDLNIVMRKMASANNGFNIMVLDACRNNPFSRGWSRSADEGGLAQVTAPTGTFIAYATAPNRTASDGNGRNGLYTAELLKFLKQLGLSIEQTFKQVTIAVDQSSNGKQTPWTSSSLRGEFYFSGEGNADTNTASTNEPIIKDDDDNKPSSVNNNEPANGVKLEEVLLSYKSNLFNEALIKGQAYLENDPDNVEVNGIVGSMLLKKNDVDKSLPYLTKAVLGNEIVNLNVVRGKTGRLGIGHQISQAQILISKDSVSIKDGDKLFTGLLSNVEVWLFNYENQCSIINLKGQFSETRINSQKSKAAKLKEFALFPASSELKNVTKKGISKYVVSCRKKGGVPIAAVKLINNVKLSK